MKSSMMILAIFQLLRFDIVW